MASREYPHGAANRLTFVWIVETFDVFIGPFSCCKMICFFEAVLTLDRTAYEGLFGIFVFVRMRSVKSASPLLALEQCARWSSFSPYRRKSREKTINRFQYFCGDRGGRLEYDLPISHG